jgi:protein-S-isoprenylcysteine O-methyltransferase Ste14
MNTKMIARYLIRETMGLVILGVALFWPAGRFDWWPAWAVLAVMAAWIAATLIVILRYHPQLLAERLGPRSGSKRWDTAILSALGLIQLARYVLAGFDQRYGWSSGIPLAAQLAALILCVLSYALVVWATGTNAYFSQIVRIQEERQQTVIQHGPYRGVRHPAYAGAIVYELVVAFLLASWPALLLGAVNVLLLILRTALEDRTLQAELEGYREYALRTRFRLVPGVW